MFSTGNIYLWILKLLKFAKDNELWIKNRKKISSRCKIANRMLYMLLLHFTFTIPRRKESLLYVFDSPFLANSPQLIAESSHLPLHRNRILFYVLNPQPSPLPSLHHPPRLPSPSSSSRACRPFFPNFFLTPFPSHNSYSRMAEQRGMSVPSLLADGETTPSAHCRLSFLIG